MKILPRELGPAATAERALIVKTSTIRMLNAVAVLEKQPFTQVAALIVHYFR
jgi:hypothetical protein|tara:strand:+ start:486 stop:641 length:156 start_codon:yes stop_codon:yes gene_type:complete